ncbi:MAG: hypothetical protein KC620_00395 [Myxococcales bacterium]|nr:hypothetical protein [Myxococcales bacterium]
MRRLLAFCAALTVTLAVPNLATAQPEDDPRAAAAGQVTVFETSFLKAYRRLFPGMLFAGPLDLMVEGMTPLLIDPDVVGQGGRLWAEVTLLRLGPMRLSLLPRLSAIDADGPAGRYAAFDAEVRLRPGLYIGDSFVALDLSVVPLSGNAYEPAPLLRRQFGTPHAPDWQARAAPRPSAGVAVGVQRDGVALEARAGVQAVADDALRELRDGGSPFVVLFDLGGAF